jgi:hypothetical protein
MEVPYRPGRLPASTLDEAARSATLSLHGQRYFVTPATAEAAIAHYRASAALKRRPWWPLAQRVGERIYFSGIKRALRWADGSGVMDRSRAARLDRAAAALRRVAQQNPYLSNDAVWRRRTSQLVEQVAQVRDFLGRRRRAGQR